jgi:hypothetical protein
LSTVTVGSGDDVDAAGDATQATVDAPPDSPPQTNKSWVVIETLTVPVNGTSVTSQTALTNGVTYHLRASGTFVIQSSQGTLAEFWDFANTAGPQEGVAGVDCGMGRLRCQPHDGNFTNNTGSLSLAILSYQ